MSDVSYIWGGTSPYKTYEELKRAREGLQARQSKQRGYPTTLGQGMTYLGEAVGDRLREERIREGEAGLAATDVMTPPGRTAAPAMRSAAPPTATRVPTERVTPAGAPTNPIPGAAPTAPAGATLGAVENDTRDRIAALDPLMSPEGVAQQNPMQPGAAAPPVMTTADMSPGGQQLDDDLLVRRRDAIGGIESGDEKDPYRTLGVRTKYGRAAGRYGVMEVNVPKWTQEVFGKPMTVQQFINNDRAQDAVFDYRFGQYVAKYGEENAARAWFGGEGNINNPNATDAHERLSVRDYGQDYLKRLRGQRRAEGEGDEAPVRLAALGGAGGTMTDAPPIGMGGSPAAVPMMPPPNTVTPPPPPPVPEENPPTPTDIRVVPTQMAQVGPEMFSPRRMADVPVTTGPAIAPVRAAPGAAGGDIPAAPTPLPFPEVRPEPKRAGPTPQMEYYLKVANETWRRPDTRAEAARRYQEEAKQQDADYVRDWTDWRKDIDEKRKYDLANPKTRQEMEQAHLNALKTRRELEGEGWRPISPERLKTLGPLPAGVTVYENRKGELRTIQGPATTTVTVGDKGEESAVKAFHKKVGESWAETLHEGMTAADDKANIAELRRLAADVRTGPEAAVKSFLGKYGIKTEGIGKIEALEAAIDRITPTQRVPGSGATSDFDAKMMKGGIVGMMKTPEGNALVLDTMERLADNKMKRAEIVAAWAMDDNPDKKIGTYIKEMMKLQLEAKGMSDRVKAHLAERGITPAEPLIPPKTEEDSGALDWANRNPTDPRAIEIKRMWGR